MEIPLSLPIGPCWELEERPVDSTKFLQILPASFPEATAIFFEGSSIAPDVVEIFEQYAEDAPYLPKPQTLWSTGRILRFRCRFMPNLCETLAKTLRHHADRLPLLEWPDAFSNCIWIASSVPESRVSAFAANLNLSYKYLNSC
jgi:hypothetical protein